MPTVLRRNGYRVVVYPADHRPAHVHGVGASFELVFNLNCPTGPLELRNVGGEVSDAEIGRVARLIGPEVEALCAAWSKYHGHK